MQRLKNNRGVALMVALFAIMLIWVIVSEMTYEARVEYTISSNSIGDLKAYYAAKSGVELSLLRILVYKKAVSAFGDMLGNSMTMLDPIWSFPFAWPPVLPDEVMEVDKDAIDKVVKEAKMDASYITTITTSGSKIDLNDLASPVAALKISAKTQLKNIFENQRTNNPEWFQEQENFNVDELINNMIDWQDEDNESLNGGSERNTYQNYDYPNVERGSIPPNRPFRTVQELRMVADMNDAIFDLLEPRVTVYGIKGVNINHATKEVLLSLDPAITDKIADEIIARRNDPELGGAFKNNEDFEQFLASQFQIKINADEEKKIPLLFGPEYNFVIESTGQYGRSTKKITAIVYDIEQVKEQVNTFIKVEYKYLLTEDCKKKQGEQNIINCECKKPEVEQTELAKCESEIKKQITANKQQTDADKKKKTQVPAGRPNVIFWQES